MRAKERLGIMLLFLYAFCFISCDKDDDSVENIAIMSVSPELVWMRDSRVQVMVCSIEGDNEKLYIAPNQIEGFEYNKGYDLIRFMEYNTSHLFSREATRLSLVLAALAAFSAYSKATSPSPLSR